MSPRSFATFAVILSTAGSALAAGQISMPPILTPEFGVAHCAVANVSDRRTID